MSHGRQHRGKSNPPPNACPHGMPSIGSCVECMDEGNIAPPRKIKREGWPFVAGYEGTCSGCKFPMSPGELIVRMADATYRHSPACEKLRP